MPVRIFTTLFMHHPTDLPVRTTSAAAAAAAVLRWSVKKLKLPLCQRPVHVQCHVPWTGMVHVDLELPVVLLARYLGTAVHCTCTCRDLAAMVIKFSIKFS